HDMPPLRAWWQALGRELQGRYLVEQLPGRRLTPDSSKEDIFTSIISAHIASPAMFVILPIQDWMSIDQRLHKQRPEDEQINHPENPQQRWCYRLPIDMVEAQTKYADWTKRIREMLQIVNRE
ncbi:MAG: 4-alpha-glucanotransferase, partial [Porphyromonas sp.]|nr:4-alpha-glucanotransferase [Porphyromonas sp.]